MMSSIENAMGELGLSSYEIKAYLCLLHNGRSTAEDVCKYTNLPYSRIHTILKSLEEKGWIEREIGKPNYYYPKPPKVAVKNSKIKIMERINRVGDYVIKELQPIYEGKGLKERPDIWIIYGITNIVEKVKEVIASASSELLMVIPFKFSYDEIFKEFLSLRSKGIRVRILSSKHVIDELPKIKGIEVRYREKLFGGGIISDGKEAILFLNEPSSHSMFAVWSRHTGLTTLAKEYFEYIWNSGT
ncbi:MAG: TrmB family transcriptional regulator [Candidatus Asgardarchaeia archaeon]